jgi:hypothetical protein
MSRSAFGSAARINLKELRRRAIKLPLKKLGHAIEDWVANQSPIGNSSVIDAKAFEWVERLEKNSEVIRQELVALLYGQKHLPNIQEISPRQWNLSRNDGWKSYFFFVLGHRIDESYKRCPETGKLLEFEEPKMQAITTIGLDIAKSVFQVHGVDAEGNVVLRRQLKRRYVLAFFQNLSSCLVGIEACASSHHWLREPQALGHTVRLMPPAYVKQPVHDRRAGVFVAH